MLDSVKLKIDILHLPHNFYQVLYHRLPENQFRDKWTNLKGHHVVGKLRNIDVKLSGYGLEVSGSIPKYLFGDNLKTPTFQDIQCFIQEMDDQLGVKLLKSTVKKMEIGANLFMKHPIREYLDLLIDSRYFDRLEQRHGLLFRSENRVINFYNKIKEMKKREIEKIDPLFANRHILRFEYRYSKNSTLSNFLKVDKPTFGDVLKNYHLLVNEWANIFQNINKHKIPAKFDVDLFRVKGSAEKQLLRLGIESIGGELNLLKLIRQAHERKYFDKYPNEVSNLRSKYKKLMLHTSIIEQNPLISELEKKVEICRYFSVLECQNGLGFGDRP